MEATRGSLILASASSARRALLAGTGLAFETIPADLDESRLKADLVDSDTETVALSLSEAKAKAISKTRPEALVIGADQILDCEGRRFDKPRDPDEAKRHLLTFRGKTHRLVSGLCLARGGEIVWRHVAVAHLTMRSFSNDFLEDYLARSGPEILESVGVYRLEGLGVHLFDHIDGDYFTILGLPLLPLLAALRTQGVVAD